jgi:hypothetical protein
MGSEATERRRRRRSGRPDCRVRLAHRARAWHAVVRLVRCAFLSSTSDRRQGDDDYRLLDRGRSVTASSGLAPLRSGREAKQAAAAAETRVPARSVRLPRLAAAAARSSVRCREGCGKPLPLWPISWDETCVLQKNMEITGPAALEGNLIRMDMDIWKSKLLEFL